jgi:hypothetical protein
LQAWSQGCRAKTVPHGEGWISRGKIYPLGGTEMNNIFYFRKSFLIGLLYKCIFFANVVFFLCIVNAPVCFPQVKLLWDANTGPAVAGYRLYYGTSSKSYTASIDVGNHTTFIVAQTPIVDTYYAVTAYTSKGDKSDFSNEVVYQPPETPSDIDGDGAADTIDGCPTDPLKTSPGMCGCGDADTDADSDGTPDCNDDCPSDPLKTSPGICGCGDADTDADNDGTPDCNDDCPTDSRKTSPGICGCGDADTDADNDGTPDCNDDCPTDSRKTTPGICGCGVPDTDTDKDGVPDCHDNCPATYNPDQADQDYDGKGDACEPNLVFYDDFSAGNYSFWMKALGNWKVMNGEFFQTAGTGRAIAVVKNLTLNNYIYSADVKTDTSGTIGLVFRYKDTNNYYCFYQTSGTAALVKYASGRTKYLTSQKYNVFIPGQIYKLTVQAQGSTLKCYVDDVLIFQVNDTTFSSGKIGLYTYYYSKGFFDNILVE